MIRLSLLLMGLTFISVSPSLAQDELIQRMPNGLSFYGYPCTQDCSGHKAGFEWSQRKAIQEKEQCGGRSNSFIEGCYAWVEYLKAQEAVVPDAPNALLETE